MRLYFKYLTQLYYRTSNQIYSFFVYMFKDINGFMKFIIKYYLVKRILGL